MAKLPLLFVLLALAGLSLGDRRDIERVIEADLAIHNLKFCGSCKITWLPEHNPCSGESTVVAQSGCTTMSCLCDTSYRETRSKWILTGVEKYCGAKDTVTPQLTVDWFNNFCDAQLAILATAAPAVCPPGFLRGVQDPACAGFANRTDDSQQTTPSKSTSITARTSSRSTATAPANSPGSINNEGNVHNEGDGPVVNCNGDNCTIGSVAGSGASKSDSDRLILGLSFGLGIPTLVITILALCAYAPLTLGGVG